MRVAFAGSPDFAVRQLRALVEAGMAPVGVLSQPARPAGRGNRLRQPPVAELAQDLDLPLAQPARLDSAALAQVGEWRPDLLVVAAYGLLLPKALLRLPPAGCLNVHASLLPRWRGASPVQRAICAGDAQTGISFMLMDQGLDTGAVVASRALEIRADDTGGSLTGRLAELAAQDLPAVARLWHCGQLQARPQPDEGATSAPKLEREQARLDWSRPAVQLERQVRAFSPWPAAWTLCGDDPSRRVKVLEAALAERDQGLHGAEAGVVAVDARGAPAVRCGRGWLRLRRVQFAGGRAQRGQDAVRGGLLAAGERLR